MSWMSFICCMRSATLSFSYLFIDVVLVCFGLSVLSPRLAFKIMAKHLDVSMCESCKSQSIWLTNWYTNERNEKKTQQTQDTQPYTMSTRAFFGFFSPIWLTFVVVNCVYWIGIRSICFSTQKIWWHTCPMLLKSLEKQIDRLHTSLDSLLRQLSCVSNVINKRVFGLN